jgi:ACS family hexuronate transporter-like MFS transporter
MADRGKTAREGWQLMGPERDKADAPQHLSSVPRWAWGVVWLLFLATLINYMDRQTLGSTVKFIKQEFGPSFTEERYGQIEFCFLLSYGLFQIPAGFLADRLNLRWLFAGALLLWSAAGFATGLAQGIEMLMLCRLVLGIGEAFNWPAAVAIVRRLVPLESRGLANGIFHSGASAGAILTPLLVLVLVGNRAENWRLLFLVVGALGLVWVVLWLSIVRGPRAEIVSYPPPEPTENPFGVAPSFRSIFQQRQFWITLAVGVTVNICWHFYRVWLPRFLDVDLKFSQDGIQYTLAGFYVAADLGSLGSGYLTRRLTYAGYSVERSRKLVLLGSALLATLSLPAALAGSAAMALPLILCVAVGSMGGFPIFFALNQETAPRQTALCLGITGSLSLLSIAVLNPPIGWLVDQIGTFVPILIAVGFVPLIGALAGLLWPEPAAPGANN